MTKERISWEGEAKTWKAFGTRRNGGLHEPVCEMSLSLEVKENETSTVSSTCLDASIDGVDISSDTGWALLRGTLMHTSGE